MADEELGGRGPRLSKRFSDKVGGGAVGTGEVDYKTKSGTAWSHNYLNQKPWHPLSYPNQRRKWIAEQSHAQRQRRAEEVAREFSQEQEFFRQTALVSRKEKEKMEMMKAVSFMYVRPPGYNAESAKAAEITDQNKLSNQVSGVAPDPNSASLTIHEIRGNTVEDKKKSKPKDVFGRVLPTEEEFEVLKNAPRLETGVPARVKPFAVEIRNVRCVRCGAYGHQSGDRECPLKDAIMPNDESRLKRDDPLTTIMAQTVSGEPVKWELKQRPGMSPPHGGFRSDDPNQQIVAEDIFDEYGGFLGGSIPSLLTNFKEKKSKKHTEKKSKHKQRASRKYNVQDDNDLSTSPDTVEKKKSKHKHTSQCDRHSDISGSLDYDHEKRLSASESEYDRMKISNGKHKIRQPKTKRLFTTLDFNGSAERRKSKRKREQKHNESTRRISDHHRSNTKNMSKSKENVGHHSSERGQFPSASDSENGRIISKISLKNERQVGSQCVSASNFNLDNERRASKRKKNLLKERHDPSRRLVHDESDSNDHSRRRKHHCSASSDSDSERISKRKNNLHKKERYDSDQRLIYLETDSDHHSRGRKHCHSDSERDRERRVSKRSNNLHKKERQDSSWRIIYDEADNDHHSRRRKDSKRTNNLHKKERCDSNRRIIYDESDSDHQSRRRQHCNSTSSDSDCDNERRLSNRKNNWHKMEMHDSSRKVNI